MGCRVLFTDNVRIIELSPNTAEGAWIAPNRRIGAPFPGAPTQSIIEPLPCLLSFRVNSPGYSWGVTSNAHLQVGVVQVTNHSLRQTSRSSQTSPSSVYLIDIVRAKRIRGIASVAQVQISQSVIEQNSQRLLGNSALQVVRGQSNLANH